MAARDISRVKRTARGADLSGRTSSEPAPPPSTPGADLPARVSAVLEAFVQRKRAELAPIGPEMEPLLDAAAAAVGGGKRLRPAFAYWGWRAAGGSRDDEEAVVAAASAIELVHASALVHDDVMDDSATRRGLPSSHRRFAQAGGPSMSPARAEHFGRSAAILLGDLLLAWSDELFATSGVSAKSLARARPYFDKLRTEVAVGQYLDVLSQAGSRISASDAMRVVRYKSAKYTVERPLQFGAALGRANDDLLRALSSYGVPLGEAFQLRDDVLGVFGQTSVTGKPSGDDIREGKRTLLMARAHELAGPEQRAVLAANLGNRDIDEPGVEVVRAVLHDCGALAAVETVITELASAASTALASADITDDSARRALQSLARSATQRTS